MGNEEKKPPSGSDELKKYFLEDHDFLKKVSESVKSLDSGDEEQNKSKEENESKPVVNVKTLTTHAVSDAEIDEHINQQVKKEVARIKKQIKKTYEEKKSTKCTTFWLAFLILIIILGGLIFAINTNNFAYVPFGVVLAGIVAFFGIMIISNQLADKDDINSGEMRRAIAVAVVVVYLGLLPTLAFQGILQYQVLGLNETPTSNVTFNESSNVTTNSTIQAAPLPVELSQTAISSFTALVTAVILSYFGLRTWKEVEEIKNPKQEDKDEK